MDATEIEIIFIDRRSRGAMLRKAVSEMDEYIKRSEVVGLVEDKLKQCETVNEVLAFASLRIAVMGLRSADVAPRAEVDKAYWEGVEYGHKDGAALVARNIFEEIKDQLRGIFDFFRQDNDIRESCAIMFAISEVDKIEKKYTQPEPPKGD